MNIIYFLGNKCYYKDSKKIHSFDLKDNSLKNGRIANKTIFLMDLKFYLKKHNLISNVFSKSLKCIINSDCTQIDVDNLVDVLEQLNFKSIKIIKEIELLDLNNTDYLCFSNKYCVLYYKDKYKQNKYKIMPMDLFESITNLASFINSILVSCNRKLFLYGSGIDDELFSTLNDVINNSVYLICDPENYMLNISSI